MVRRLIDQDLIEQNLLLADLVILKEIVTKNLATYNKYEYKKTKHENKLGQKVLKMGYFKSHIRKIADTKTAKNKVRLYTQ